MIVSIASRITHIWIVCRLDNVFPQDYAREGNEYGGSFGGAARYDRQQWCSRWRTRKMVKYVAGNEESCRGSKNRNRAPEMIRCRTNLDPEDKIVTSDRIALV